jgi:hypothetical protein
MMEIAMRISESKRTLESSSFSSGLIEPDARAARDPIRRRTSGSGH